MNKFWCVMVFGEEDGDERILHRHKTRESANDDAESLASRCDSKFFVMELVGACQAKTVAWLEIEDTEDEPWF